MDNTNGGEIRNENKNGNDVKKIGYASENWVKVLLVKPMIQFMYMYVLCVLFFFAA